ncbi:MAG TPA: S26 family signal peptidase [Sedimentisphaerales bacterium]|nr:S26 family signal peptidase [Sedimentisphaerales bacterium]
MQSVDEYIDQIMEIANLAQKDKKRVRCELESHIYELVTAGEESGLTESEVIDMIEKEFGDPNELGKMISKAKGKFLTYLKKETRKLPIKLVLVLVIALSIRVVAFEAFKIQTDAVSQAAPQNTRVLINKLVKNFDKGDIVTFHKDGYNFAFIGIVKEINENKQEYVIGRNNEEDILISRENIIGKAFFLYSWSL